MQNFEKPLGNSSDYLLVIDIKFFKQFFSMSFVYVEKKFMENLVVILQSG